MSYFPFPSSARRHRGIGEVAQARFAVLPNSLDFWEERLMEHGVKEPMRVEQFLTSWLEFTGPDGENLAICETDTASLPPAVGHIPSLLAIRGFHPAQLCVDKSSDIGTLLTFMGFVADPRDGDTQRFQLPSFSTASIIDVPYIENGEAAQESAGSVHHIAFAVKDDALNLG